MGGVVVVHIDDVGRLCLGAVRVNIVAKSKVSSLKLTLLKKVTTVEYFQISK